MEAQFTLKRHSSSSLSTTTTSTTATPYSSHQNPKQSNVVAIGSMDPQFRILCPGAKVGGLIGKGGAVIRQLREDTGAKIRIVDDFPASSRSDERVIVVSNPNPNPSSVEEREDPSVAQLAVVKVIERIWKVDEERSEKNEDMKIDDERRENVNGNGNGNGGNVVCRLLAQSKQVGSVLGKGGKIVEKIRHESGAQVRILPRDQLPACASSGEELIQITGNAQAVKKALMSVTSCLQEHPRADTFQGANVSSHTDSFLHKGAHAADHHSRSFTTGSALESIGHNHRMIQEDDVVFRLLCIGEKIGSLIGKGGNIIRAIQNETGASIKIGDPFSPDSEERVVIVSARECMDLKRSPAQDAVMRVYSRIAEIAFEPGAAVTARLLVHSQHIGCLLGKGGLIIAEMRRLTGASIRIFGRDQGLKLNTGNDELVQIIGSLKTVQDALYQITSRLRETLLTPKQHHSHINNPPYFTSYQELPSPSFRPRHDHASPGHYQSPGRLSHAYDSHSGGQGQVHPSFSHDMDRTDGFNGEHDHHHYGSDRSSYGMSYERPSSPNAWHPQAVDYGNPGRYSDSGPGPASMSANVNESGHMPMMTSVEVVVPQTLLPHVYGDNKTNLGHITQFSGADITVHDPKPGATEGRVVLSGTPSQLRCAQSLVQALILCGQVF